jgi:hypothetical protein
MGNVQAIARDILPLIFKGMDNKDRLSLVSAYKWLYELCKEDKKYWQGEGTYSEKFIRSICAKNIQKIIVNKDEIQRHRSLHRIRKLDNIKELRINYRANEIVVVGALNKNIKKLELYVNSIGNHIVKNILENDQLESLIMLFHTIEIIGNTNYYIDRIGKNYKRISLSDHGITLSKMAYDEKVDGLQILELCNGIYIKVPIIMACVKTLVSVNIGIAYLYGAKEDGTIINSEDIHSGMINLIELRANYIQKVSERIVKILGKLKVINDTILDIVKIDTFDKLENLEELSLSYHRFDGINFKPLVNLVELWIDSEEIAFEMILCLKNLELLTYCFEDDIIEVDSVLDIKDYYNLCKEFDKNTFPKLRRMIYKTLKWIK